MTSQSKTALAQIEHAYRTKGILVLNRCRTILRNEADSQDAFHETFRRLLKYKPRVETEHISLSYLYRTAERCCFDMLRHRKKTTPVPMDESVEHLFAYNTREQVESAEILKTLFYQLDDKLKRLALLYYMDGLTQEEIATELGWSRRTVGKKISKIRKLVTKLKK